MPRPIVARIDPSALAHNVGVARAAAQDARVLAVAKANAYGHGLLRVLHGLAGADGLALLDLDEAARVRDAGFRKRVVLLEGLFESRDAAAAARYGADVVVHCREQVDLLREVPAGQRLGVLVKLDTGLNRLGFPPSDLPGVMDALAGHPSVRDVTLMTHFACADDGRDVEAQLQRFRASAAGLRLPATLANSAALLRYPEARGDWVRPGIMLYGASPFADATARELGLRPVMTLESRLISTRTVRAGDSLGYGFQFTADRDTRVGIVACGYADGYPRHAPTGTPVRVGGISTRTLGRVSMDMLTVDLSPCPDAGVGTRVVLWGDDNPVDAVARAAGTIGYELLCAVAPRVPVVVAPVVARAEGPAT
ncbi:MAG: alanine racemase [Betaproteobacteria bacterium]|nr:alanine racemase [Betaproteobacteria bacterium]